MREAGLLVLANRLEVALRVGPADHGLGDVVLGEQLRGGLVVLRDRELLPERALHPAVRPDLVRRLLGLLLALRVADRHLRVARLAVPARLLELLDRLALRRDGDQGVAGTAGQLGGLRLGGGDRDRGRLVRERVDPRLLDGVVRPVVRLVAALPEQAQHLDRLLEHLQPLLRAGPHGAGDVLVQLLAGADAQEEAALQHHLRGCRGLGDDRRMDPDRRAGHARAEAQLLGGLRDPADHAPDERALALRVDPGVVVVGDQRKGEARLLGQPGVAHEVVRAVLLRGERVAEFDRHTRPRYLRTQARKR